MYGDRGFLDRLNRVLAWSFPIGRWMGIEVRVYGSLVIVPLIAASTVWSIPGIGAGEVLTVAAIWTVCLYAVVLTHELGHAWMAWRYRIPTGRITLSPLGGLAHLQAPSPTPKAEILVSVAGPAVHVLWLAVVWPLSKALPPEIGRPAGFLFVDPVRDAVQDLVYVNAALAVFNLLPFFPMDGGRVLRSLLAMRMHPNRATIWAARVGTVGAIGLGVAGLLNGAVYGGLLLAIGISNWIACRQEILAATYGDGPYGPQRDPWEADPDAWRYGASVEERPGLLTRMRSRWGRKRRPVLRSEDTASAAEVPDAPDDAELDRLLEKVGEVGITGLTRAERAALQRASEARRR